MCLFVFEEEFLQNLEITVHDLKREMHFKYSRQANLSIFSFITRTKALVTITSENRFVL